MDRWSVYACATRRLVVSLDFKITKEDEMKKTFYVDAIKTVYYRGEFIEASTEEVAIAEYQSALENGLINIRESDTQVDACEEVENEEEEQLPVV
jgi:hypothetical protein